MPGTRMTWYAQRVQKVCVAAPVRAHAIAVSIAAGAAAKSIRSTYSGSLSRDLSRPRFVGPMRASVGSSRRYARMEAHGGEIHPRTAPFLVIRGRRVGARGQGTRSTYGGPVTATEGPGRGQGFVVHEGKHWDAEAIKTFVAQLPLITRRLMLQAGAR